MGHFPHASAPLVFKLPSLGDSPKPLVEDHDFPRPYYSYSETTSRITPNIRQVSSSGKFILKAHILLYF